MSGNHDNNNLNRPEGGGGEDDDSDFLALSLGRRRQPPPPPPPPPPPVQLPPPQTIPQIPVYPQRTQSLHYPNPVIQIIPANQPLYTVAPELHIARSPTPQPRMHLNVGEPPALGRGRARRNSPRNNNGEDNNRVIQPPYPWATNRLGVVHHMERLKRMRIETITGMVRCNKCDKDYEIGFNLEQNLMQFWKFVAGKEGLMHDRADTEWLSPPSLTCKYCNSDGVKPIINENKENINWLFLFLGQMLGYCTLEQLKYFCGCTSNHRTGAKDRVLYLAYREIFKQLLPDWPQDSW